MSSLWKARLVFAFSVLFLLALEFARVPVVVHVQLDREDPGNLIHVEHGERPKLASADTAQSHVTPAPHPNPEN